MFKSWAILTLLVLCSAYTEENGVLSLTDADLPQVFTDYPSLFIKFYTPWCGHCKKLAPIFIELAESIKSTHPQIKLAEMDLDANKQAQAKFNVNSYPTLIYFLNGQPHKFGGSRTLEFMTFWLNKKTNDPIVSIQKSALSALETDGNVNIVFYGSRSSPKFAILQKIATNDDYNMYYQTEADGKQSDSIEVFRPFAKSVSNNIIDNNVKNWIGLFDRPFVYPFNDRSSGQIFTDKRNAVFFFNPEGEVGQSVRQNLFSIAFDWKIQLKRRLIFAELYSQNEEYKSLADYFKIDPQRHFLIFVKTAQKLKYLYSGSPEETTKEKIAEFLKNVDSKKIKPVKLDQETRPTAKKSEQL